MYNEAIVPLSRAGFIHYAALANEHCGKFLLARAKDEYWGGHYLNRAVILYRDWKAVIKVEQLMRQFPFLASIDNSEDSSILYS
eukprot:CAMPEP_0113501528 /NCGR_PEP_ID=MMETSP0014_2-20120614/33008_1 /TAXON_ID=2857 /ORGANISM="Nitzschia sp." /LENGTH=83 /DNA_ID=CAMNT_0000396133 /DNA_START=93 /DNA_END=341 /DNA_ORIENTATION=+ /assembly_acc=CAM_ASM_000159